MPERNYIANYYRDCGRYCAVYIRKIDTLFIDKHANYERLADYAMDQFDVECLVEIGWDVRHDGHPSMSDIFNGRVSWRPRHRPKIVDYTK